MKIAYTSDLHIDFYFGILSSPLIERKVRKVFDEYFSTLDSKYLIVAGDDGHYPKQNVRFYNLIKKIYGIEKVIVVLGNHNAYLVSNSQRAEFTSGLHKMEYTKALYRNNNIDVLDGTTIEIEGITIGGADSWYDGSIYYRDGGMYSISVDTFWKHTMNDSSHMRLQSFYELASNEKKKLAGLQNKCDVMVTHICPSISDKAFHMDYQGDLTNAFYSFDWEDKIIEDVRLKHWVYGHTHSIHEFTIGDVQIQSNPWGYPGETQGSGRRVKHLTL